MRIVTKPFIIMFVLLFVQSPVTAQIEGNVLAIGDSLTAGLQRGSNGIICIPLGGISLASNQQRSCIGSGQRNIGGWQPELSQAIGVDVFNYGNTGEFSFEILNRINTNMAQTPSQFVLILAGTNDVLFNQNTVSGTIANLEAMVALVRGAGREPIIGTLPPLLFSEFNASNDRILDINTQIRAMDNIQVADHYAVLVDEWAQNTSGDFIHIGDRGDDLMAQEWERSIRASLRAEGSFLPPIINLLLSD